MCYCACVYALVLLDIVTQRYEKKQRQAWCHSDYNELKITRFSMVKLQCSMCSLLCGLQAHKHRCIQGKNTTVGLRLEGK